jgi:hypothetical protein
MVVMRLTVAAIIVSAPCVVAHAQEGKPCRAATFVRSAARRTVSGFAESRDQGSRRCPSCRPYGATGYLAAKRRCAISTTTRAFAISIRTVWPSHKMRG